MAAATRQSTLISAILVCMVFSTRATGCREGQQCSDCNRTTGYCETECYTGFFDLKCRSSCSKGCRHGQCVSTGTGIGRCTEGCVPGVYDIDCKIPCTREEATCVQCPSTCEEGYCQLNSTCVSGCVDSYYGSECKDCSSRCKTCNRITGTCKECQSPFHGLNCSYTRSCVTGCVDGCGLVVSANFCVEVCKGNCRPALNMTDASRCLAPSANPQVLCTSECHSQTGECLHGCVEGWYGPRCSAPCSAGCSGGRCDAAGACVDGCRSGYFGRDCEPCHDHCYNHSCNPYTGSCVDGCIVGFYGEFCNDSCNVCSDDMCHQATGMCINGCNVSHSGCKPTCTSNCSRDYCLRGITCAKGTLKAYGISIGIPVTCVLFVLAILMTNYICYRKGRSVERENRTEDEEPRHVVEYQSWHKYYDIDEGALDTGEPTENQENLDEELGLAMPVIAEVFPTAAALAHSDHDESSESSAASTSRSYTHLIPDVVTRDPGTVDSYISPVEESILHLPATDVVTEHPGTVDSYISPVEESILHSPATDVVTGDPGTVDSYISPVYNDGGRGCESL